MRRWPAAAPAMSVFPTTPAGRRPRATTWQAAWPGRAPIASTQVEYSLLQRGVEREVLPACRALGLGLLPWSPLGRGVLSGKYRGGIPADSRAASPHFASFVEPFLGNDSLRVVTAVATAAEGLGLSPLEVALAWVRDRPGVTAPVVGARTAAQLQRDPARRGPRAARRDHSGPRRGLRTGHRLPRRHAQRSLTGRPRVAHNGACGEVPPSSSSSSCAFPGVRPVKSRAVRSPSGRSTGLGSWRDFGFTPMAVVGSG